jgi:DNA-nicking Smr family endonuclease
MSRKNRISPEDSTLFRDSVGAIAPLPRRNRAAPSRPPPSSRPLQAERDEREVIDRLLDHPADSAEHETGEAIEYRGNGISAAVMRKLRRGQYAVQDRLDLHGSTVAQARAALVQFLQRARQRHYSCVRIIHGKGLRSSAAGPVLKPRVAAWLRQHQAVLAYCSARPVDGGSGAVYVLLRRG